MFTVSAAEFVSVTSPETTSTASLSSVEAAAPTLSAPLPDRFSAAHAA